jgi:hypothetical protein
MAMLVFSGTAAAADQACPAPSAIKQAGMSNAGTQQEETDYVATANGKTWKGSVSEYDEHKPDLKTLGAGKASTANAKGLVACDYYNGDVATLRLTPDAPTAGAAKAVAPTGK